MLNVKNLTVPGSNYIASIGRSLSFFSFLNVNLYSPFFLYLSKKMFFLHGRIDVLLFTG